MTKFKTRRQVNANISVCYPPSLFAIHNFIIPFIQLYIPALFNFSAFAALIINITEWLWDVIHIAISILLDCKVVYKFLLL